jgi:glycosyltransferase involved in cell wall biosynthesis
MKISVIIPSYKPDTYLWDCLDSLQNQILPDSDYEVVLILNGCCEPYKSEIEAFIKDNGWRNLRLFQTDTPGVSNARNIGLDNAIGDYIAFIDDDDIVSPSYLSSLYEHISDVNTADELVISDVKSFEDNLGNLSSDYLSDYYAKLKNQTSCKLFTIKNFLSNCCCKLVPRALIADTRFDPNFKNGEDTLFMYSLTNRIKRVTPASNDAIYYRRLRKNSASRRVQSKKEIFINRINEFHAYAEVQISNISGYPWALFIYRYMGVIYQAITFRS